VTDTTTMGQRALIWDMTLAWNPVFRDQVTLPRLHALGVAVVGLTIGTDRTDTPDVALQTIAEIEALIVRDDRFMLIRSTDDVKQTRATGKLGVELNFQGIRPLGGRIELVEELYRRGVRHASLIWNNDNEAGGSSATTSDPGLTSYGRALIAEMERVGMIVDGAHAGYRTTMQAMEVATRPFIISHTNCHALEPSYKNIRDDQIVACAATGGVMGVSGFGAYLGDHIAQRVGADHVGLGLDYVTKPDVFWKMVKDNPSMWPSPDGGPMAPCRFADHAQISDLADLMSLHGYSDCSVRGVLGENWLRVATKCWQV
jgi:membrane dipeptidase